MKTCYLLQLFIAIGLIASAAAFNIKITSTCSRMFPVINTTGPGCSIPAFVDAEEFGDNLASSGRVLLRRVPSGTLVEVDVRGLSRPDLVLTAWFVWADPGDSLPKIFDIASRFSPVSSAFGHFTAGIGPEANSLRYISRQRATMRASLGFNPTKPNQGPLVGARPSFQRDIPGIEKTRFRQFDATPDGRAIPITASFLRKFNRKNGFQKLDSLRRPVLVKSPTRAVGIAVFAHIDKISHGLQPGLLDTDHFEVVYFNLTRGSRS